MLEQKMNKVREDIKSKEILLQKKIDYTNKINILIEKLNN